MPAHSTGFINPPEKDQRFIAGQQAHWEKYGYGNWGIRLRDSPELIGWAGLQYLPELEETEVGFLLDRLYWGKGYATEAAQASFNLRCWSIEEIRLVDNPIL
jgi:RimJ/RimL family protein N-acetyltransferase